MDREFFIAQVEAAGGMLYRIAYSVLRSDEDCKDALQETALKAWEKRNSLREERYFRTWMTRILLNVCCDMRRKQRPLVPWDEVPEQTADPPNPDLALALEALPEKLRLPLVLCYSEGMTYKEAAKVLRIPAATVRGRIHRGKERLRKELDAE